MSEKKLNGLSVGSDLLPEFISFVHQAVHAAILEDGHCKSYEGTVSVSYPSFFEMTDPNHTQQVTLQLDCYVLGPSRSYTWRGVNVKECIDIARKNIERWVEGGNDVDDYLDSVSDRFIPKKHTTGVRRCVKS